MGCWWPCCDCEPWFDDFDTTETGYTTHQIGGTAPSFSVTAGRLRLASGGGSYYRSTNLPTLSGLKISVRANVYDHGSAATTGIFIGSAVRFEAVWATGDLQRQNCDTDGDGSGATTAFSSVEDGDALEIVIHDTSSGAGTYKVQFYHNDVLVREETSVSLSLSAFTFGVVGDAGGEWDNLQAQCVWTSYFRVSTYAADRTLDWRTSPKARSVLLLSDRSAYLTHMDTPRVDKFDADGVQEWSLLLDDYAVIYAADLDGSDCYVTADRVSDQHPFLIKITSAGTVSLELDLFDATWAIIGNPVAVAVGGGSVYVAIDRRFGSTGEIIKVSAGAVSWRQGVSQGTGGFLHDLAADSSGNVYWTYVRTTLSGNQQANVGSYTSAQVSRWMVSLLFVTSDVVVVTDGTLAYLLFAVAGGSDYRISKRDAATGLAPAVNPWTLTYAGWGFGGTGFKPIRMLSTGNIIVCGENADGDSEGYVMELSATDGSIVWDDVVEAGDGADGSSAHAIAVNADDDFIVAHKLHSL